MDQKAVVYTLKLLENFDSLGTNTTISASSPFQVKGLLGAGFLSGVTQVTSGRAHSCAIVGGGSVYCWGSNSNGQLGANVAATQSLVPLQVVSASGLSVLDSVVSISAGAYHTCAISTGGSVFCWGQNSSKQLGNDSTTDSSYPIGVLNTSYVAVTGAYAIGAGYKHTCIIAPSITTIGLYGEELCWGSGYYGQLGTGGSADIGLATNVVVPTAAILTLQPGPNLLASIVSTGSSSNHSCAIGFNAYTTTNMTVGNNNPNLNDLFCWGLGTSNQLGTGVQSGTAISTSQSLPMQVTPPVQPYFIVR